jgi:hypothetical protein
MRFFAPLLVAAFWLAACGTSPDTGILVPPGDTDPALDAAGDAEPPPLPDPDTAGGDTPEADTTPARDGALTDTPDPDTAPERDGALTDAADPETTPEQDGAMTDTLEEPDTPLQGDTPRPDGDATESDGGTEDTAPGDAVDAPDTTLPDAAPGVPDALVDAAPDVPPEVLSDVLSDVPDVPPEAAADVPAEVTPDVPPFVPEIPRRRVGIFYLAWHTYAATAMRALPPEQRFTIEDTIRRSDLSAADLLLRRGLFDAAVAFHYHAEPQGGFYCLYRARPGDPSPGAPDCPDIEATARRHAEQILAAGVDFVFADLTNLPEDNPFADVLGLRPIEVLFEEWQALRNRGIPTPDIAIWVPATEAQGAARPLFRRAVEVYGRPEYRDLVMRDPRSGLPVMFIVDQPALPPSDLFLSEITAAGIIPVRLWGNMNQAQLDAGAAAWMQPCTQGGLFTTLLRPDQACNQFFSRNTPIGSVVSVSASYQVGYASMPWQASGRLGGLTLQKQFETAFREQPDWLLINAWNEHIAQPQTNPYDLSLGPLSRSMGIGTPAPDDPSANWLWVDCYGHDLSRDLEPTVGDGDGDYRLLQSCVRTYRLGPDPCATPAGASEACCNLAPGMLLVRVLRLREGAWFASNHVPTLSTAERDVLVATGAYDETCNPAYGPPGVCGDARTPNTPFLTFAADGPGRAPIFRCLKSDNTHLISSDAACEGQRTEGSLGWVGSSRTSETPRALRRCYNTSALRHFHTVDAPCPASPGVVEEAILGWVR